MVDFHDVVLIFEDKEIAVLNHPKLKNKNGIASIECFLNKDLLDFAGQKFCFKEYPDLILHKNVFKIRAKTRQNSIIEFLEVLVTHTSYPSFKFVFTCYSHSVEYANVFESDLIDNSVLSSINIEGWKLQYNQTSQTIRNRSVFGKDDVATLSMEFDHLQITLSLWFKKRYSDLQIALIKHPENKDTIIVRFYGESKIPFRIYDKIKYSIIYFISYLAGNNIIIREVDMQIKFPV